MKVIVLSLLALLLLGGTCLEERLPERPVQKRKVAVFLINSPDGISVINYRQAEEMVWTNPVDGESLNRTYVSARTRYLLASYDIIDLVWDGNEDGEADIFGPYESEWLADGECHYAEWGWLAKDAALKTNPEIADYDHFIYVLPWVDPTPGNPWRINGCLWGGLGSVGGKAVWLNFPHAGVITHEIGHNLGMSHGQDPTDLMGGGVGLSAPNLIKQGILPSSSTLEIDNWRNRKFTLLPISVDPYDLPGLRVVKIQVENGDPYYISYRDNSGVDQYLDPEYQFNVIIHRWDGWNNSQYITAIKAGGTFKDAENELTINSVERKWGAWVWGVEIEVNWGSSWFEVWSW